MKEKQIIGIIAIILVVIIIVVGIILLTPISTDTKTTTKDSKTTISLNKTSGSFENINFTDVKLEKDGNDYTLTAEATNNGSETAVLTEVSFNFKDEGGNDLLSLIGYIGEDFKAGETRTITSTVDFDLSTAYTFTLSEYVNENNETTE